MTRCVTISPSSTLRFTGGGAALVRVHDVRVVRGCSSDAAATVAGGAIVDDDAPRVRIDTPGDGSLNACCGAGGDEVRS